jgi:ABC-type proline/glycine betaine transport system substrate-binding protein
MSTKVKVALSLLTVLMLTISSLTSCKEKTEKKVNVNVTDTVFTDTTVQMDSVSVVIE